MALTLSELPLAPARTEAGLVDAARHGDDRAFEQLYAQYREPIHGFIQSRVRDHGRAEDLGQEVFMAALRQLRADEREIAFKPWLYTIARNACIDDFRRGRRAREVPIEPGEELPGESVVSMRPTSAPPTPLAAAESRENLEDLRRAFGGLSDDHRRLIVMREFEGLSYDEIGSRLEMTRPMVESGLFRARRKLSEEYDELASGRRCAELQQAVDRGRLATASGLGIKERRRYVRHLSHCQPCRRVAMITGVDEALLKPRSVVDRIAALLPFALLRDLLPHHGAAGAGAAGTGAGGGAAGTGGAVGAIGAGASGAAGAGAGAAGITAAQAAAIAALALTGAGGGYALSQAGAGSPHLVRPAITRQAIGHARDRAPARARSIRSENATDVTDHQARTLRRAVGVSGLGATARPVRSPSRSGYGSAATGAGSTGTTTATHSSGGSAGSGSSAGASPGSPTAGGSSLVGSGNGAAQTVSTTAAQAPKTVSTAATGVKKTVGTVATGVDQTVSTATGGAAKTVSATTGGVAKTVGTAVGGAGTTVSAAAGGVAKTVAGATSGSPGAVATGVQTTVDGAASGVGQTAAGTTAAAGTTVAAATGGAATTATGVSTAVGTTVTGVATTAGTTVTSILHAVGG